MCYFRLVAIAFAIYWQVTGVGSPFFITLVIEALVLSVLRKPVDDVLNGSETAFAGSPIVLRVAAARGAREIHLPSPAEV